MAKLETVTGIAPSHWASYLINGDASCFDLSNTPTSDAGDRDFEACKRFEAFMGGPIVSCEDAGFCWKHDASSFGVGGADCQIYTALIEASAPTGPEACKARGWHRDASGDDRACSDCGAEIGE